MVGAKHTFRLKRTKGCAAYPEAGVDVTGKPHAGVTSYQEVRGYVDAHTHGMAFEFLGGDAHCGKPWDRFGAPYASGRLPRPLGDRWLRRDPRGRAVGHDPP